MSRLGQLRRSSWLGYALLEFAASACDGPPSRSPGGGDARLSGSLFPGREQVLEFAAPAAPGGIFRVTLAASAGAGELGVSVTSRATGRRSQSHVPFEFGQQRVGVVSEGGTYEARVSAALAGAAQSARARAFTLAIEALPRPLQECCSPGSGPGCGDAQTLACVCERDNHCCSERYDETCVAEAIGECALRCMSDAAPSDCCETSEASGCVVPEVEACVCGIDPYCCAGSFDQNCANLASSACAAHCSPLDIGEE